jgi:phosphoribosylamine-glycine ligase
MDEETIKTIIREAQDDYEDGEMLIEVVEGRTVNGEEITVKATIDEYDFIRLYGADDFKILMHNGEVGDVIGQGKWYRAKIIKQNHKALSMVMRI